MDANALVLTQDEVPAGLKLRQSNDDPGQAQRVYGKGRFLKFGDAIWSEATVMRDEQNARDGWKKLVELHNQGNDYDNAQPLSLSLGDASYIHTGTMRGRPGLWAAVRIGLVIHRFNTYGVGEGESLEMLRQQVQKSRSRNPQQEDAVVGTSNAADSLASALWAFANLVGEADTEFHRDEIKAANDWLRSAAFSAQSVIVKDAALIAARNHTAILNGLAGRAPAEIFEEAKIAVSHWLPERRRKTSTWTFSYLGTRLPMLTGATSGRILPRLLSVR